MRAVREVRAAVRVALCIGCGAVLAGGAGVAAPAAELGQEVAIDHHLQDGEEFTMPRRELILHGGKLFDAMWTMQEGGGRPLTNGHRRRRSPTRTTRWSSRATSTASRPPTPTPAAAATTRPARAAAATSWPTSSCSAQRFDFATFERRATPPR